MKCLVPADAAGTAGNFRRTLDRDVAPGSEAALARPDRPEDSVWTRARPTSRSLSLNDAEYLIDEVCHEFMSGDHVECRSIASVKTGRGSRRGPTGQTSTMRALIDDRDLTPMSAWLWWRAPAGLGATTRPKSDL